MGAGMPSGGDLARQRAVGQDLPARLIVITGVQVHHWLGGQRPDHLQGVQGRGQQPIVTAVGRGRHGGQGDAARLDGHRALHPLLAAVDRAWPGHLAAAGRFGGAAVHGQLLQRQAEQLVIGGQHGQAQLVGTPALIHSSRRRRRVVAEQVWSAMRR